MTAKGSDPATGEKAGAGAGGMAGWRIRPASLVDVPAIVRLAVAGAPGAEDRSGPADPQTAQGALRLLLSHVVLERGRLLVAAGDGALLGASIWLPAGSEELTETIRGITVRELGTESIAAIRPRQELDGELRQALPDVLETIEDIGPDLVLFTVALADELAGAERHQLATSLLRAAMSAQHGVFLAVAIDAERVRELEEVGFAGVGTTPLAGGELWIGSARSSAPIRA